MQSNIRRIRRTDTKDFYQMNFDQKALPRSTNEPRKSHTQSIQHRFAIQSLTRSHTRRPMLIVYQHRPLIDEVTQHQPEKCFITHYSSHANNISRIRRLWLSYFVNHQPMLNCIQHRWSSGWYASLVKRGNVWKLKFNWVKNSFELKLMLLFLFVWDVWWVI